MADFSGGAVTSNDGALLLGLADASLDLTRRLGQCFDDHRDPALVVHEPQMTVGDERLYHAEFLLVVLEDE